MGLKGNLATVNLADVFQVLARGHSTGLLRVQAPDGMRFVEIQDGTISIVSRNFSRVHLGDLLVARTLLTEEDLKSALLHQKESGKLIGEILQDMGLVKVEDLEAALRFQIEEEICELFLLKSAEFDFLANASLDAKMAIGGGFMRLRIDPNSLLMEVARRVDEWKRIEQRIPSQAQLFQLTPEGEVFLKSGQGLSQEGLILLQLAHDRRSVEAMVQKACLGRMVTNQLLLELLDAALIQAASEPYYLESIRCHLAEGRLEEARRVAAHAVAALKLPACQEAAQKLSAEVEAKWKLAAEPDSGGSARVRTEVVKRTHPTLILRKRGKLPVGLLAGAALVLVGAVVGAWFMLREGGGSVTKEEQAQYDASAARVEECMGRRQYQKALEELRRTWKNPALKVRNRRDVDRHMKRIEADVAATWKSWSAAVEANDERAMQAVADDLKSFGQLSLATPALADNYRQLVGKVTQWEEKRAIGDSEKRLAVIEKDPVAHLDDLKSLCQGDAFEVVAVKARAMLAGLAEKRLKADQLLRRAEERAAAGDVTAARAACQDVVRLYAGFEAEKKAREPLRLLDEKLKAFEERINRLHIKNRTGETAEARQEAEKFLAGRQEAEFYDKVRTLLRTELGVPADEASADALLQAASSLEAGQPAAARARKLELLRKYPFSRAAARVEFRMRVESVPEQAQVRLNGVLQPDLTPTEVAVPGQGFLHLAVSRKGSTDFEAAILDPTGETIVARLGREPSERLRLLPHPATHGWASSGDWAALVHDGEVVVLDLSKGPEQPLLRSRPSLPAAGQSAAAKALPALHDPAFSPRRAGQGPELFIATQVNKLVRLDPATGKETSLELGGVPLSRPLLFYPPVLPSLLAGVTLEEGFECLNLTEGKPCFVKKAWPVGEKLNLLPPVLAGACICVACADGKLRGFTCEEGTPWKEKEVDLPAAPVGGPVFAPEQKAVTVLGTAGEWAGWDAETGEKRWSQDLGRGPWTALAVCGKGFALLNADGQLEYRVPDQERPVWSLASLKDVKLPLLPAEGNRLVLAAAGALSVVNMQTGKELWRAALPALPLALSVEGKRILVSTEDALLLTYSLE